MKTILCIGIFLLAAALAQAQTNNLTGLLQEGLFEEQANRNLDAAIADYQTLAKQFDKDRQLAATAVFRLGECYRAQGRTNEAAAQYQRIIREFGDQQTLVTLSRQDLAGMGMAGQEPTAVAQPASENSDTQLWSKLKDLPTGELARVLPTLIPNATLDSLLQQRNDNEAKMATIRSDYSTSNIVYVREQVLVDTIQKQIDEQIAGMMQALKLRAEVSKPLSADNARQRQVELLTEQIELAEQSLNETKQRVQNGTVPAADARTAEQEVLKLKQQLAALDFIPTKPDVLVPRVANDEDQEIQRIQQMIQNSPDLINAPSEGSTPLVKAAYNGWLKVAAYLLDHGANIDVPSRDLPWTHELRIYGLVSPLVAAVGAGNKAMTQLLIDRGADVNFKGDRGEMPLQLAAEKGFQAVTEVLLASHADVNGQDDSGESPLISAVESGQLKMVQMILAAGADVNHKDGHGRTALNFAIQISPEILQALLAAGVDPNLEDTSGRTPLSYAAEKDDRATVNTLLAAKADPNAGDRAAPLLRAVFKNDTVIAEAVLRAGANPNTPGKLDFEIAGDSEFSTRNGHLMPLWLAIHRNEPPMVQLLLKYKADPNDTRTDNNSLLFAAWYDTNVMAMLLEAGADANFHTDQGWTPVARAVQEANLVTVQLLLKFKARPNDAPIGGKPLLFAALPQTNILEALLDAGTEVDSVTKDEADVTPLASAAGANNAAAVEILLKHGANPNVRNRNGATPLHWAAHRDVDSKIFELLLDHGADPNVRSSIGRTPLDELRADIEETGSWPDTFKSYEDKATQARKLIALLHQHGALDHVPDWDGIDVGRVAENDLHTVFHQETNDWNHFTLIEAVANAYMTSESNPYRTWLSFPDFAHVAVLRPTHDSTNQTRIEVNLLAADGGINFSNDMPLLFGEVVDIPEHDHVLGDISSGLSNDQQNALANYVKGSVQLVVQDRKVQIPIYRLGDEAKVEAVLNNSDARGILLASSDLSRVKVIRRDAKTGKQREWVFDCRAPGSNNGPGGFSVWAVGTPALSYQWNLSGNGYSSSSSGVNSLWLCNGDVIEVPEKQ